MKIHQTAMICTISPHTHRGTSHPQNKKPLTTGTCLLLIGRFRKKPKFESNRPLPAQILRHKLHCLSQVFFLAENGLKMANVSACITRPCWGRLTIGSCADGGYSSPGREWAKGDFAVWFCMRLCCSFYSVPVVWAGYFLGVGERWGPFFHVGITA